jgi:hypothetical protein
MASQDTSGTRAVVRTIDAGSSAICVHCDQLVKFSAKVKRFQVICNVYVSGRWNRVEHFHLECYQEAGSAHGEVDPNAVPPPRRVQQARDAAAASAMPTEAAALSA